MEHANAYLEKEPVKKLMRMYSVPCIISLLVAALYNIVDQIFIANAGYLGSYGNAANTVVFPLTIVALAVAVMIGDGACAYVSILLGSKRNRDAASTVGNVVILSLAGGILILIYGLKWGMKGAAIATIAGQIITAVLAVWYLFHMKAISLDRASFSLRGDLIKRFLPLGLTSLFSQISLVAAMAAINNMIRKYGAMDPIFGQTQYAQIPMAVVGIVMKFFQIVISIAAGCIPIAGYNIGDRR